MKEKSQVFTIPNILSFFRIAMIPAIVVSFIKNLIVLCVALILVSGLTDLLDGFIARRFNMITPLGKALDPVADKLTLGSILIMLAIKKPILFSLFAIFIVKEVFIGIQGLLIIKRTGTTYSAKWYGKITTLSLYASTMLIIVWESMPQSLTYVLLGVCLGLVIFSMIMYTLRNFKALKQAKTNSK
ncbi:MAG: CDP-alcohol phosphatidyltransferase family protein [Clostridia bacterium]|nr:CDP-alcohol phosphatidyltransferase family protein [Clostridia bacterium]